MKKKKKDKISMECWDLDVAFFKWLKKRLKVYLKEADEFVDLDYQKFEYEGNTFTQKELIEILLIKLEIITGDCVFGTVCLNSQYVTLGNEIIDIWKVIWPAMWW